MGFAFDHLYAPDGLAPNLADRVCIGSVSATYASTSGTAAATVAVSWTEPLPTPYCAIPTMQEQANWWITGMTSLGFTFHIAGLASLSGATIEILLFS